MGNNLDRRDYSELVIAIDKLDKKLDHNTELIFKKFDDHILNTCVPTRMELEKKIVKLETRQGIFSSVFGFMGGAVLVLIKMFFKN